MRNSIEVLICGDICPTADTVGYFDKENCVGIFNDCLPLFEKANLLFGNLEFVLTDTPKPIVKSGPILHGPTSYINVLKKAGFDVLSLANNHIKDCGEEGVKSTIETCENVGIETFGAGSNLKEAKKPFIKRIGDFKIGFMAFAEQEFNCASENEYGANFFDPYQDLDLITEIKKQVDYLLIIYHGGIEYYEYPSPILQKKCRKFIDKGADFVTCQHSHCIGTIENYSNRKILYGQGNTLFGYRKGNDSWNQGLLVKLLLNESGIETQLFPIHATSSGIALMDAATSQIVLEELHIRSLNLLDQNFINSSWEVFCESKKTLYFPWLFGFNRYFIHANRIFKNVLIKLLYSKTRIGITQNIIRCEAHNEVVDTILNKHLKG